MATAALGAALAPLLMAPTMERFGWRAVFLLSGVIGAVTAVTWRALMPPPVRSRGHTQHSGTALRELAVLLRNPQLLRLSLAYLLHSAVWFVFVFWFFRYLVEGRGFTVLASGIWGSLPSVAGFVCAPLFGIAADRLGIRIGTGRARRRVAMPACSPPRLSSRRGRCCPARCSRLQRSACRRPASTAPRRRSS